jgi:hypothetical protein
MGRLDILKRLPILTIYSSVYVSVDDRRRKREGDVGMGV